MTPTFLSSVQNLPGTIPWIPSTTVTPHLFRTLWQGLLYPLMLALHSLCRPGSSWTPDFLFLPPEWKYWDSRCIPPHQGNMGQEIKLRASYRLHKNNICEIHAQTLWRPMIQSYHITMFASSIYIYWLHFLSIIDTLLQRNIGIRQLRIVMNQFIIP